jgi:molybdopterin synthase catalytic subunit
MFALSREPLDLEALRARLMDPGRGAYVGFEGRVRNRNHGREVLRLEYEAYPALALKEGSLILAEAAERFGADAVHCAHRVGRLEIGEIAVWVGAASPHRDASFAACAYAIDEIKKRVPIWKREHYAHGDAEWVECSHLTPHGG